MPEFGLPTASFYHHLGTSPRNLWIGLILLVPASRNLSRGGGTNREDGEAEKARSAFEGSIIPHLAPATTATRRTARPKRCDETASPPVAADKCAKREDD